MAALHEAKTLNLANATALGVLEGPEVAKTLVNLMNLVLDPLIQKYNAMEVESD